MKPTEWHYPEAKPDFIEPGAFNAWIAGSGSSARSAAAWRVESANRPGHFVEAAKSSASISTAPRALLASLAGVLEALPFGSEVKCYTRGQYAVDVAISLDAWISQGWQGSDGPLANRDILERIAHVLKSRKLVLNVCHVTKGHQEYTTVERLTKRARGLVRDLS